MIKATLSVLTIALMLTGCNDGDNVSTQSAPIEPPVDAVTPIVPPVTEPVVPVPSAPVEPVVTIPAYELTPATPLYQMPIFTGDGITDLTQRPYSGTVNRGGNVYLHYTPEFDLINDIELPQFNVTYKYQPYLEILISDDVEDLCIRYSFITQRFGMAKARCDWSDTRDGVELDDIRAAYYWFKVDAAHVWISGVIEEGVGVE